ncbi:MAG: UDP-3-O-acyl-N-acetylglucosamine deacetylase [Candidatus Omnitrophota bacterium]|nr:UDP-3-O-acyl-N-acetylglucosamine deacetylase [Candidatus Omnitrophota bacterium]
MTKQKTIRSSVSIEGIGLQTGSKTNLKFNSAPADSGINFIRIDLPGKPNININTLSLDDSSFKKRRTTLKAGLAQIQTTEHLLSAVFALGINNINIEVDGSELPGLDGSALGYVDALERAGIIEQDAPAKELVIKDAVKCIGRDGSSLEAVPYDGFKISYHLSYPVKSIGKQFLSIEIDADSFKNQIAPARTFCMKKEAILLRMLGFGKGANSNNTLIMGKSGPMKNRLRFPDECVRHKILDLIGDLSLVGMNLKTHIVAVKSGHRLNMDLVKKLKKL